MLPGELIKAVYDNGVLTLLEPVDLPQGAEVWVQVRSVNGPDALQLILPDAEGKDARFTYPGRPQPSETLDRLTGMISVGGDALADSEALYDAEGWVGPKMGAAYYQERAPT